MRPPLTMLACLAGALVCAPAASAAVAEDPWPPRDASSPLFVHYGEERWDEADGSRILSKVVSESVRYRPAMVTLSGDKAGNGVPDNLRVWRWFMAPYDGSGIPYFPAVGNTDRSSPAGVPPGFQGLGPVPAALASFQPYRDAFADKAYPFGDGQPPGDPQFVQTARPAGDSQGASTHYYVDYGAVRWIFVDNSCWSVSRCDPVQNPPFPDSEGNGGQFAWLERRAAEASRAGRTVFVVMHMPTRDPRDQSHSEPAARMNVMGKREAFDDNPRFEEIAERTGIDAVFVGNIRAQILYRGRGRVPYYVDGGGGGALDTTGPVGVDHGYWHGYRLLRVSRGRLITDAVPVFVDGGITLSGAAVVRPGEVERYEAVGRQPVSNVAARVATLELRDPRPARPGTSSPARQGTPTTTPAESLPAPARMFTTSNPLVLRPKPPPADDPRRDPLTQTKDGLFRARCPGRAKVRVTSGFETTLMDVTVPSRVGVIARSVVVTSRRALRLRLRPRLAHRVARLRLVQPAEVLVAVRRRGRVVRTLRHVCAPAGRMTVVWDGRVQRRGRLVASGRYRIEAVVRSDRGTIRRARTVRVRR